MHSDTDEVAERLQLERFAAMTPGERGALADQLSRTAIALAEAGVRRTNRSATDEQILFELRVRMHGRSLAELVASEAAAAPAQ